MKYGNHFSAKIILFSNLSTIVVAPGIDGLESSFSNLVSARLKCDCITNIISWKPYQLSNFSGQLISYFII